MTNPENEGRAAAAELAIKAHVLKSTPEILADVTNRGEIMEQIAEFVDLTEAPEDAVSSLVTDLLHYCNREQIDWTQDIIPLAWEHFRNERKEPSER